MHFHFDFTAVEILWTLTFAAQLILLVVLLGRDRTARFKWFTAGIVVVGLRLLTSRVLYSRLAPLPYNAILITLADLGVLTGILVLVELARHAFLQVKRRTWVLAALAMTAVGAAVLALWGAWPAWKTLTANSRLAFLLVMQLAAQKGELLVNVLAVELGLVIVLFGRRFKTGWRSHTQQIAIGFSTLGIAQMATQRIQQIIVTTVVPKTQAELDQARGLLERVINCGNAIYIVVLAWWIACMWIDEPGAAAAASGPLPAEPAAADEDQLPEHLTTGTGPLTTDN
jgi:hypothetical protein